MKTAAIYARYSSDLQHERSIDDQMALCRAHADRTGLAIVAVYDDKARSGASTMGRDGLSSLMDAARKGTFQVVLVEALDRLSRDQEDLAGLWKRLGFLGIEIRAVHEGRIDAVQVGVRGLVGALYLQDLAHKVRRGLSGVIRDGRHAGGRPYGYRPVSGAPGVLAIVEEEADVIRRIFRDYVRGLTPRDIAGALNREGIAPPRGTRWNASTLNGSRQRANGILQGEIYGGKIVWNRVRMVKDPGTGKRVSRPNPPEEWQSVDAPHLALVDDSTFRTAQARKGRDRPANAPAHRRPRHLLSGLLKCGVCGGGMVVHDRDKTGKTRVRCSVMKESGTCSHGRIYYLEAIEEVTVDGLRSELRAPHLIAEYAKAYQEERRRLVAGAVANRARAEKRLDEVERSLSRLVDALAEGLMSAGSVRERLLSLEAEKAQILSEMAAEADSGDVIVLHPSAITRYLGQIENLATTLRTEARIDSGSASHWFRSLVEQVIVHPVPAFAPLEIEIRGYLAALTNEKRFAPCAKISGGTVVAEERYSLSPTINAGPTFRIRASGR